MPLPFDRLRANGEMASLVRKIVRAELVEARTSYEN